MEYHWIKLTLDYKNLTVQKSSEKVFTSVDAFAFLFCRDLKFFYHFFPFIFISWRLITLQYCSIFCDTLTWISHVFTWVPHPDSPLPLPSPSHPSGSSQCTSPDDLSHASNLGWWSVSPLIVYLFNAILSEHPTLAFSHRV